MDKTMSTPESETFSAHVAKPVSMEEDGSRGNFLTYCGKPRTTDD